jgi:hypothetical protein
MAHHLQYVKGDDFITEVFMKKSLVFVLVLAAAFAAFSAGTADEKVSLKGSISVSNKLHAELKSGSNTYLLMLPRFLLKDVKDGDAVEVEGYKLSKEFVGSMSHNFSANLPKDGEFIFVSKITYNGKTIDVRNEKGDNGQDMHGMGKRGNGMGSNRNCPMW